MGEWGLASERFSDSLATLDGSQARSRQFLDHCPRGCPVGIIVLDLSDLAVSARQVELLSGKIVLGGFESDHAQVRDCAPTARRLPSGACPPCAGARLLEHQW